MNKRQFIQQRRDQWRQFEKIVRHLDRKLFKKLSAKEAFQFSQVFRELSNDLAIVRSRGWDKKLENYLNDLVAQGHNVFYGSPPGNLQNIYYYLTVTFPQLFRRNFGYMLFAGFLLFGPMIITWVVVQQNPVLASRVLPNDTLELYERMYRSREKKAEDQKTEKDWDAPVEEQEDDDPWERTNANFGQERSAMFGFYISNNVGIAFRTFATGALMGIPTLILLVYNGIMMGTTAGYLVSQGHSEKFLSFVVTHGSFELTAIAVAGGAGFMLADAILHPGDQTMLDSLLVRGHEAIQIAFGAGVMLVIAAMIEAFWSPAPIPAILKYIVGAIMWLVVFLYLALAGRNR